MFFVRKPATDPRAGEYVYLHPQTFRDGSGQVLRHWTYKLHDAKFFKTRKGAEKAAEQWDGEVIELTPAMALADLDAERGDLLR